MNHQLTQNDMSLLCQGLAKTGIEVSALPTETCTQPVECHYINDRNGSLRWIWPAHSRNASFLRFYHTGSRKAALMASVIRLCMKTGLGRLVGSKACTLFVNEKGAEALAAKKDWALFAGTVGENRKIVAWYADEKGSFFVKIPLSVAAEKNMGNEVVGTGHVHAADVIKPWSRVVKEVVVVQPDIYNHRDVVPASHIKELPVRAVINWIGSGAGYEMINTSGWWASIEKRMEGIGQNGHRFSPVLLSRISAVYGTIWKHTKVMMAESHGDLTPWNVRHDGKRLYMIDWEMYSAARPALYDIFHYIYQGNILVDRSPYASIRRQVDEYLSLPGIKAFIEHNRIDAALAEKLYLLDIISYYLDLYSRQPLWHTQVGWLLQTWCEALGHVLQLEEQLQPRQALLQEMIHFMHNERYAVLKLQQEDISLLPATSDVDMCISRASAERLFAWLCRHRSVVAARSQKLSFMRRISLVLHDERFLHLDCIWQLKRKNIEFMDVNEITVMARTNRFGVKVPATITDMRYTWLFYLLNGASVPGRHVKKYARDMGLNEDSCEGALAYNDAIHNKVSTGLRNRPENRGWAYIRNTCNYALDSLRKVMPRKGLLITFSGVDGAGKSTIINELRSRIEKELRTPVVVLRHRPSILPILSAWRYGKKEAEIRSVNSMPRTGGNDSRFSSFLRFAYYYTDHLLGQYYVHLRYVWQGHTVLYDRFYFDLINDAKRSNIVMPEKVTRWLYRFLLKPDQNYFLFAPTGTILQRKKELDEQTINELTRKYMQLFSELRTQDNKHIYHAICNLDMTTTMNKIFSNIQKQKICAF